MTKKPSFSMITLIIACFASLAAGGSVVYFAADRLWSPSADTAESSHGEKGHEEGEEEGGTVELSETMWAAARIEVEPAQRRTMKPTTWATGKLVLNENRTSHIFSITEGLAHEVLVKLGDRVEKGQTLAVIDSREVGNAKLELYQARLREEIALSANQFAQRVKVNAMALIDSLDSGATIKEIEKEVSDKPIGKYREQLMGAYAELIRTRVDYERLKPVAGSGAVSANVVNETRAKYEVAKANYAATLEQLRFSIPQDTLETEQALRQAKQAVDVAKAKLYLLGYADEQLQNLTSTRAEEHLSHYEVKAPFAGTIIGKNLVLAERVGTDTMMFRLADLSTVWVQADIYQKDLPAIRRLGDTLRFRAPTGDDGEMHTHRAEIFYRGDLLDADTRTLLLRAVADNEDGHLKPGMFVEIEIPGRDSIEGLTVPESALIEIDGEKVVFVQDGEMSFRKTPVVTGQSSDGMVQVREGLKIGDKIVTSGAFALKSELLKSNISHGH